jgi:hypothetical protein
MVLYDVFSVDYLLDPDSVPRVYAINPSLTPSLPH